MKSPTPLVLDFDYGPDDACYEGCLYASLAVAGANLHLMAIEVDDVESTEALNVVFQSAIDATLDHDDGLDSEYELATFFGRHYFVIAHPYQK